MPVRRRSARAAAVVAAAAAFAAACGGDPRPTTAEWADRADAICRAAQDDLDRRPPAQSPLPGEPLRQAADATALELAALKKLRKPDDEGPVEDYLVTLRLRNDELLDYAAKIDKAPAAGPRVPIERLLELTAKADEQARALGLTICGAGVDPSIGFGPSASTTVSPSPSPSPGDGASELSPDEANTIDEAG